jgi:hypothetical protein
MEYTCENCNNNFERADWKRVPITPFCSRVCYNTYKKLTSSVELTCATCNKTFSRFKSQADSDESYCSSECRPRIRGLQKYSCGSCDKEIYRYASQVRKSGKAFCNSSCSAMYSNTHRKPIASNRSKLEMWLEGELKGLYPDLDIHFNDKMSIALELDIYIPSKKLAFELNGVFHYENIFKGSDFTKRVRIDEEKVRRCIENGIDLVVIDTREQKQFYKSKSGKFLKIIIDKLNKVR